MKHNGIMLQHQG